MTTTTNTTTITTAIRFMNSFTTNTRKTDREMTFHLTPSPSIWMYRNTSRKNGSKKRSRGTTSWNPGLENANRSSSTTNHPRPKTILPSANSPAPRRLPSTNHRGSPSRLVYPNPPPLRLRVHRPRLRPRPIRSIGVRLQLGSSMHRWPKVRPPWRHPNPSLNPLPLCRLHLGLLPMGLLPMGLLPLGLPRLKPRYLCWYIAFVSSLIHHKCRCLFPHGPVPRRETYPVPTSRHHRSRNPWGSRPAVINVAAVPCS